MCSWHLMFAHTTVIYNASIGYILLITDNSTLMKSLRLFVLFVAGLLVSAGSFAQRAADPAKWRTEIKKKSATEYQLVFHLSLDKGWHIWSLNPGGDGMQLPPDFSVGYNPDAVVKGKPTEKGKATTTTMDGINGKVTWLSGNVDYTIDLVVKKPTKIVCKYSYQVCDDRQCLAPVDKEIELNIP